MKTFNLDPHDIENCNLDRLAELIALLETVDAVKFNFCEWVGVPCLDAADEPIIDEDEGPMYETSQIASNAKRHLENCGTVACVGGWAATLPSYDYTTISTEEFGWWLNITRGLAFLLTIESFTYGSDDPTKVKVDDVIPVLKELHAEILERRNG